MWPHPLQHRRYPSASLSRWSPRSSLAYGTLCGGPHTPPVSEMPASFPSPFGPTELSLEASHLGRPTEPLLPRPLECHAVCWIITARTEISPVQITVGGSFTGSVHSDRSVSCSECSLPVPFWLLDISKTTPSKGLEGKHSANIP